MKTLIQIIAEAGGQGAGILEVDQTSLNAAREYAKKQFEMNGRDLDEEIPDFNENYTNAKKLTALGRTKRRDMPVINTEDVKQFQWRLKKGRLDIKNPYAKDIDFLKQDPFPEGLTRDDANKFLEAGLSKHDGSKGDDVVSASMNKIPFGELKPIQKQIYFDKSIDNIAAFGVDGTISFLKNKSVLIASNDNFIIDGHHRWLSGLLIDPKKMKSDVLLIDLPIKTLLPLSRSYGDAIGNQRNQ